MNDDDERYRAKNIKKMFFCF